MTAWSTPASGRGRSPMLFTDENLGQPKPWTAALLLEPTATPARRAAPSSSTRSRPPHAA
ncbi:hypothetical protein ID875_21330 [Streptomyces globisporus]|uniref:Uncharacterized protein n=1 Tax=Streptomyces globisporus TaxID=1908 RepID=A0A927GNZ7_STRGL|nr:hypothetical protein [Streptomyces globisporus]